MSEELENSLRQAVESHLSERLHAIDEQLSRLQTEFNDAFARLRESSASESLDATPISAAIAAHMQAAREQKLSGAASSQRAAYSADVADIKRSVVEIEQQQSQSNVLTTLLTSAARFAERVALFVIRNEQAIGWRVCESTDQGNLEAIPSIALSLTADSVVSNAARSRAAQVGAPGSNSEDSLVTDKLGGQPEQVAAVPLMVRGKVVAVLYADSTSPEQGAVNLDALETLVRVAGMAVDIVSSGRATQPAQVSEPTAAAQHGLAEPPTESYAETQPAEQERDYEPSYTPRIEPHTHEVYAPPVVEAGYAEPLAEEPNLERVSDEPAVPGVDQFSLEPVAEFISGGAADPVVEEGSLEPTAEYVPGYVPEYIPQSVPEYVPQEEAAPAVDEFSAPEEPETFADETPAPEPVAASPAIETTPQAAPSFTSHYSAPLGSARRYGVAEPDLPIEVGEEERRLHNDARRFARLLVSEIKLYNEPKVKEGRSNGDLYDRLREDIDRSRQMYNKRVAPPVAARHDYFHQELVNTLAEGDPAKLGMSYPGAAVAVS